MMIISSVPLQSLLEAYGSIIIDNWLLYHKWDVVWSCLYYVALTDVMLVALFIATGLGGICIGSLMHSFIYHLCNLSLRHTEVSSLITDYYIINEMLYGLAYIMSHWRMLCLLPYLLLRVSEAYVSGASCIPLFIICYSRHMWFFEKNISLSNVRAYELSSANFVPLPKKRTVQFDLTKMQNTVFDFIPLLQ